MLLRTAIFVLVLLPGCSIYCRDKGELAIDVIDADGEYVGDAEVEVTSASGDPLDLEGDGGSWYAGDLKPGDYELVVIACDGDQVVERTIEVEPTNRCQDKDEVTSVFVELDDC